MTGDWLKRLRHDSRLLVGAAILLFFLVGYILFPALKTFLFSFTEDGHFSLVHYLSYFKSSTGPEMLWNSFFTGFLTVIVCGVVGTLLAFIIHYFEFPFRRIVDKLLLLPVMLPGIIIVYAFVQLYGESGLVTKGLEIVFRLDKTPYDFSGLPGILIVHAYTQYVYFYISVSIAIRHIDQTLIESARGFGASKMKCFTSIILPFITPALIISAAVTFMTGIGSFTAPSIIGGRFRVLTTGILLSRANNRMDIAATQVVLLTIVSLLVFILLRWYEKKSEFQSSVKSVPLQPKRIENRLLRGGMMAVACMLILMILLPVLTIIMISFVKTGSWMVSIWPKEFGFENYIAIFTKRRTFAPFLNSLLMALTASTLCLMVALPASWMIEKTNLRIRGGIELLVMLPWAMPASAIAINLIHAGSRPTIFSFNTVLIGSFFILPLGYFIRSLPIMVRTVQVSFGNLSESIIEASKSLGATTIQTFTHIVVPVLSPGLLAGFLLVFLRSIGEYTVSAFLYTASNRPVSIAMVNAVFEYNIGLAMAYGTLLILLTILLSILIEIMAPGALSGKR